MNTVISIDKLNKNKYRVGFDSREAIFLSEETIYSNNITKDTSFTIEEIEKIIECDDYIVCKNYAFNLMGRFSKTKKELLERLVSKGHSDLNIKKVIDLLESYGLIDDKSFARNYVMSKLHKESKEKIIFELSFKGIDKEIITEVLNELVEENEDVFSDSLMKIAQKKYSELKLKEDDTKTLKEKLYSYLTRKGFKWDEIKCCVNKIMD